MKKPILFLALALLLAACSPAPAPTPALMVTWTPAPAVPTQPLPLTPTFTPAPTTAPSATAALSSPSQGYGPTNFPAGIDPLTGLAVPPRNLERRPLIIKVENLPRNHRPQFGLSRADIVYEYYTEEGTTRFAAIFYGQDAKKVAPIRSARWFDLRLVPMYGANFTFGGAYDQLLAKLFSSPFSSRLVLESTAPCPALCRYDPNGSNLLVANTAEINALQQEKGADNARQPLDGMLFQAEAPAGGSPAAQVFTRFSGAIYNRWDYDPATGRYLRFSDEQDDTNQKHEVYAQLTDRLDGSPVAADTLVVALAPYFQVDPDISTEVLDIRLEGSGQAYAFRDGQAYPVQWRKTAANAPLTLVMEDGTPFPFKPGQTWFEVMGFSSKVDTGTWRFTHAFP